MKYIFTVYVCGKECSFTPLDKHQLMQTIKIYLANDITEFHVKGV